MDSLVPNNRLKALDELQKKRPTINVADDKVNAFVATLEAQGGICRKLDSIEAAPSVLTELCGGLPSDREVTEECSGAIQLVVGRDKRFVELAWADQHAVKLVGIDSLKQPRKLLGEGGDLIVGLSYAIAGVAETGSLVLVSGKDNPVSINFLADIHFVLVHESDICSNFEGAWLRLKKCCPEELPRAVNFISGPSTSADVAMTFANGVHGPLKLVALMLP